MVSTRLRVWILNRECHSERSDCFAKRSNHGVEESRMADLSWALERRSRDAAAGLETPRHAGEAVRLHGVLRLRLRSLCDRNLRSG
jgi:hypothetical protein